MAIPPTEEGFSFPYPQQGTTIRAVGQGCSSCVHSTYCAAMYWFRRTGYNNNGFGGGLDENIGRSCESWSNDPADRLTSFANERDLEEVEYIWQQGIGMEAERSGLTDAVTSSRRDKSP
jgi:hypothetical protein